ncbi:uncharacterized protein LOC131948765 [Physella acuta]|uniref:uncharacterized protein LOC131948765 n=1 Tax=Physella acuta TaxID=109671 RepID=UPI0027DC7F81|nr:uncharacterized protein LOC131948765 [Physella acuta]
MGPHVKYGVTMAGNKPFGLMIAYCGTVDLNDVECLYSSFQKLSADMPLPSNSLGKKYIILKVSGEYNTLLRVIASVARTSLSVNFHRNNIPERVWLVSAGSVYESTNPKDGKTVAVVTSNLPVAVFLYLSDIKCDVNPVYTQLIPTELYYNYYFWNMPHNKKDTILHVYKMCLVLRRFQYRWLLIDGIWQDQEEIFKEWVEHNDWQMYELDSMPGYHVVYTENGTPFGCYFYYHTNVGAGLFAVSSNVGDIHKESCTVTTPTPGDMKDNDCDGAIDEESAASSCFYLDASADTCKNGVKFDDDFDGKSDEDLARPAPVAGGWSGWSKWTCLAECGVSQYTVRRRLCNSPAPKNDGYPCLGGDEELEETYCNSGKTCANACPRGRFGLDCAGDCSNCEVECVKDSGYCPVCKEGWTGPACQTPCPEMTFGYNCKYSCSKKCGGRDCTERKYGICKPSVSVVGLIAFWFIAILGPLIGLPLWFGYKSFSKNSGNRITDLMFE